MVSDGFFDGVQLSIAHRHCSQEIGPLTDQAVCEGPTSSLRLLFCYVREFLGAAAGSPYIVFISTSGM